MPPLLYGCDLETKAISEESIAPKPICLTISANAETAYGIGNGDPEFLPTIEALLEPHAQSVWHNAKYDLLCICKRYPHLVPNVFRALSEGRIHDTIIIEKLGNLQEHGKLRAFYRKFTLNAAKDATGYKTLGSVLAINDWPAFEKSRRRQ